MKGLGLGVAGLFYNNPECRSGGRGDEWLHIAVSLSTNTIVNSHECFHSIYMMRAPDRAARLRVATCGLIPDTSLIHSPVSFAAFVCPDCVTLSSIKQLHFFLPQEDILTLHKPKLCPSVMGVVCCKPNSWVTFHRTDPEEIELNHSK